MIDPTLGTIDMSLRLWSDRIPLAPLAEQLGFEMTRLHVKGAPLTEAGLLSGRTAKRHYVTMAARRGTTSTDVRLWIQTIATAVRFRPAIVDDLRREEIEGVLWIAVLHGTQAPRPTISAASVDSVATLGLSILLEDYTDQSTGVPIKTWFPTRNPLMAAEA